MSALDIHPDRLLPADPGTREIARRLYTGVKEAPIYSPHGHVMAELLYRNDSFADPASLLITPDHYVTRMLHAGGVSLDRLGIGTVEVPGSDIWRELCQRWHLFAGTPVRFWFESQLSEVFGLTEQPNAENADALYQQLADVLATPVFRPKALFQRFNIKVLATTDDPVDDLAAHRALHDDPTFDGQVLPTFRPDRFISPGLPDWPSALRDLHQASGIDCGSYAGLLAAFRDRRQYFIQHGATATDSGVVDAWSTPLEARDAERLHRAGLAGTINAAESAAYRHNLVYRMAEMSCDDGLVMQLHAGVLRNHHDPTYRAYGPDRGHDLPDVGAFTRPLRPLLRDFGTHPNLRLVLFTVDETTFSREIAPLAGFYPSVYVGAPWWFLDTPAAIGRFHQATCDSAGFYKTSGFIDDTRAFCSIPARHDMSRRCDASFLAGLVAQHQLSEEDAAQIAADLVGRIPIDTFRLPATVPAAGDVTATPQPPVTQEDQ